MPQFVSPGANAHDAIVKFLAEREMANRQRMLDELMEQDRAETRRYRERELSLREQDAQERRDAQASARDEKAALTRASAYDIGEIVSPEDVAPIQRTVPGILSAQKTLPGRTLEMPTDPLNASAAKVPGIVMPVTETGQMTYRGTPEQRQAQLGRDRRAAFMADPNVPAAVRSFLQAQDATGDTSLPASLFDEDEPTQFTLGENDIRFDDSGKVIARGAPRRDTQPVSQTVTQAQRNEAERWKYDRLQALEQELTEGQTGEGPPMADDVLERRKLEIENVYRRQIGLSALTALPDSWKTGDQAPPPPAPKAGGRTASQADVAAVAQRLGVTVAEAQKQLEARGVAVR